ncbi:ABC transporter substrate-binding protein [Roseomonas hellenica]|uniref:ABC transporter substrate-binding protein n=1 Tax=Plastoroseomonas hellenica TaxID=2687306 RepID=A0ABS5EXM5_9PROT|nr:ABC transporter substrate-binding protein [Plastoroseomonas hellenica]MBR0665044.1 ABC transporter substrate-binding protein [Plastoroseomonas hellenica]
MKRRSLLMASAAASLPLPAVAQNAGARTLRFVPQANLTLLDPVFTTAAVTITHGYCVFDTLYGVDNQLRPRPQMAEGATTSEDGRTWLIRLRDGLRFHDGEPVRAQDCVPSLARWSRRDTFGQTLGAAVDAWEAADDRTIRIRLKRPFPRLLDAIAKPHSSPAFMMPERLARTDPATQVTEMVGSGPFRFLRDEYVSGSRATYARFDGYVPRTEAPEWTAGAKRANFDRLEWVIMPDPSTASAALQAGEIDWWEQALPDLLPVLSRSRNIRVQVQDPLGFIAMARFNHLHPPFNNLRLRQAVLSAVTQDDFMQAITAGDARAYRQCLAMFPCGMPGVKELGAEALRPPRDLGRARAAIREAGYAGEKVVIINPSDYPSIAPLGRITADLLQRLGMTVDLQETDWGTLLQRRLSREPVERGGWSLYHTNWPSASIANPAVNTTIRGQGAEGWTGWFENAEIERLTEAWLSASDDAEAQRLFDEVHRAALDAVPILPLGQYFVSTAYRSNLSGILPGSAAFFWNVRRA